jgi:hypothetical protein
MRTDFNKLVQAQRCAGLRFRAARHRGVVLVAVIVLLSVSLTLFALWSRAVVREQSRLRSRHYRLQAGQLAEAGLRRAVAMHATDADYSDEVWSVPASELDKTHAAQVRIRVAPMSDAGGNRYEATAEFPVGALQRVQITRSVEIPNSAPMKKS